MVIAATILLLISWFVVLGGVSAGIDWNRCTQKDMIEILQISNTKNRNTMPMPRPINSSPKEMLLVIDVSFISLNEKYNKLYHSPNRCK